MSAAPQTRIARAIRKALVRAAGDVRLAAAGTTHGRELVEQIVSPYRGLLSSELGRAPIRLKPIRVPRRFRASLHSAELRFDSERLIPKTEWGDGPWQSEPDFLEWKSAGFHCGIRRAGFTGALCGYVGLAPGHPLHGMDNNAADDLVNVHGGLTFAEQVGDLWWIGFDCSHTFDFKPALAASLRRLTLPMFESAVFPFEQYRTIEYVREQVELLVTQLFTLAATGRPLSTAKVFQA